MNSNTIAIAFKSMSAIDVCASTRSTVQIGQKDTLRIVNGALRLQGSAIIDAEVVCLDAEETVQFDLLHSRLHDRDAVATAFDLLTVNGEDIRRKPFVERKSALRKLLRNDRSGIKYVEHCRGPR